MCSSARLKVDFKSPEVNSRYQRKVDRNQRVDAARTLMDIASSFQLQEEEEIEQESGTASQTDVDQPLFEAMQCELQTLRTEHMHLKEQVSCISEKYKVSDFEGNDDKTKYYTGLPTFALLWTLFTYLEPHLPVKKTMDKFQLLIMTLMRLRLNLPLQLLSYEFGVHQSTISRLFAETIDIMFVRMEPFILWPEREQLRKTMPMQFRKHFGTKVSVIIDCFEVFMERPSNLLARAKTWSSYKHHHTAKFLIGITPQGSVSFISRGWGGRVSDKFITEHCGFLTKILPGDIVLADRGFDISDTVGSVCNAEVRIPAFTKGRSQLSPLDIESTRKLASVRIQVERVIGVVRQKYSILSGTIPIEFVICPAGEEFTLIDKIACICCALVNMCPSTVDFD